MDLHINDILTGLPVTPLNFDTRYMYLLPWEIMEMIWYYLPITTKIRVKKKYYERYHYLIYKEIRHFDRYMENIIKNNYKYLFRMVVAEKYIDWTKHPQYYSNFDSYVTNLLVMCDANKNPEFKQYLIHFKKEIAENKLKERETYKDYGVLHNIRNIWKEDEEITQKTSNEQKQ
jgi:hypothetical protein